MGHMQRVGTMKRSLLGQHWKCIAVFFSLVLYVLMTRWWLGSNKLFSFPLIFFLSSPCQNIKLSFNLFFVFNFVLVLLIAYCFVCLSFSIYLFFNYATHHLVSFNFYIKFDPYSFYYCLFICNYFPNWILFLIHFFNIWFQIIFISNLVLILNSFHQHLIYRELIFIFFQSPLYKVISILCSWS